MKRLLVVMIMTSYALGIMAQSPFPVRKADFGLYQERAGKGDIVALFQLGYCYYRYFFDDNSASACFEKSAKKGYAEAQRYLSYYYGIKKDDAKAFYWLKKAADNGCDSAQFSLGYDYFHGVRGLAKDEEKGYFYLQKAADQGHLDAIKYILPRYDNKGQIHYLKMLTDREKQMLEVRGDDKYTRADLAWVKYRLGRCYFYEEEYPLAFQWLKQASDENNSDAHVYLAFCYFGGFGVEVDSVKAINLYKKSAEQGNRIGQRYIGNCYYNGFGIKKDDQQAVYWWQKAVDQGDSWATHMLGVAYYYGIGGLEADKSKGLSLIEKAAEEGYVYAQYTIGTCYYEGDEDVLEKDEVEGLRWLKLAVENGSEEAKTYLAKIEEGGGQKEVAEQENVDIGIPVTEHENENLFAVIIGNEQYRSEPVVPFAINDAKIVKEYCSRTFGIPEKQIKYVENAGYNDIRMAVNWLKQAMRISNGNGKAIFYYAGHGMPDEAEKTAYLLPVDGMSSDVESAYSVDMLCKSISEIPAKSIIVLMDASFNGAKREGEIMASARGVAIKVKPSVPVGNLVVFTASQNDETAFACQSQKHGMFTYYLLRKLRDTKGDVTLGELSDYVTAEVSRRAFADTNKQQTPKVSPSQSLGDIWREMSIK